MIEVRVESLSAKWWNLSNRVKFSAFGYSRLEWKHKPNTLSRWYFGLLIEKTKNGIKFLPLPPVHIELNSVHLETMEWNHIFRFRWNPETKYELNLCLSQIHSSLRSQIGCRNPLSDGFSWTLLKCIHGDQKVNSNPAFIALKVGCNLKLAVALTIMEECFLPMVDTRTGIYMIPHVVYNWG